MVQKLRAHGADLSDAAVAAYYNANLAQFTTSCVSVIVTDTQAHADQLVAQINAGASFESVAKASSLDSRTAANGGSLGCSYTEAQVEQSLQVQSVTAGQPIAPVQDSSTGQWIIYEVTSQTVAPLSAAGSLARRELLQSTANINRVNKEIVAFARSSDVVDRPGVRDLEAPLHRAARLPALPVPAGRGVGTDAAGLALDQWWLTAGGVAVRDAARAVTTPVS